MKVVRKSFFVNVPDIVAEKLLGKILIRKYGKYLLSGRIVETEAYFDKRDPASRAAMSDKWLDKMLRDPGKTFVYMVHNNWLLNIVAHEKHDAGAVLIRALEPLKGMDIMKRFRNVNEKKILTNGPGKLTQALKIDKTLDNIPVYEKESPLIIVYPEKEESFEVMRAFRIGVKKDLPEPMRFYIKGNEFVSRK